MRFDGPDPANPPDSPAEEPRLITRRSRIEDDADKVEAPRRIHASAETADEGDPATFYFGGYGDRPRRKRSRAGRWIAVLGLLLVICAVAGFFYARHHLRAATVAALPQLDGSLSLPGLSAAVTVQRDARGIPHIRAGSLDDLVLAQGFITAQDRLFQMDLLRRHAAGELAAILGPSLVTHDRIQRTLMIRRSAEATLAQLPPDQLHLLEVYSRGVNAAIDTAVRAKTLPVEFQILQYTPAPWTPRDSLLVAMSMFQNLTDTFSVKLARAELAARLNAPDKPTLLKDLYPVGSWRDHPPSQPVPDLTTQSTPFVQIPLDPSQSMLAAPPAPSTPSRTSILAHIEFLLAKSCDGCSPGSNEWAVSGAHTASGKPLLANDMHLVLSAPDVWYAADLEAASPNSDSPTPSTEPLHVAGVSLPGLPLIVVGHTAHIAWGFTNLGADVQDVYRENLRGVGSSEEFLSADSASAGTWQPVVKLPETIVVRGGRNVAFNVNATRHGDALTPILDGIVSPNARAGGHLSLRWTLYDPSVLRLPMLQIAQATDWTSFVSAFSTFGGPAQNVVYADDQGHIGYHATGRIPLRGPASNPASSAADALPPDIATPVLTLPATITQPVPGEPNPLSNTEIISPAPPPETAQLSGPISPIPFVPAPAHEWTGYIPYDQLPQAFDPPGGILATANARVTPDNYPYPITLDWAGPYRNERIWRLLAHRTGLTPSDMLALQTDVTSDFDRVLAERLAYAIDHAPGASTAHLAADKAGTLHQAADLLRNFDGTMATNSPAAAIVSATHAVLWPMLLAPKLSGVGAKENLQSLYDWGEKDFALEELLEHTPARWLSPPYTSWDDLLAAAVLRGLTAAHAPADLSHWTYGSIHKVDIEHPLFAQYPILNTLLGRPTGSGPQPQSGDATTIKQVGFSFGPSERFTADLANPDQSTLNLVLGESGNPASPHFLDQFPAWLNGTTFPFAFTAAAIAQATTHTLTLNP